MYRLCGACLSILVVPRCKIVADTAIWARCRLELFVTCVMPYCALYSENPVSQCLCGGNWAQWRREIAYEKSIAALVR